MTVKEYLDQYQAVLRTLAAAVVGHTCAEHEHGKDCDNCELYNLVLDMGYGDPDEDPGESCKKFIWNDPYDTLAFLGFGSVIRRGPWEAKAYQELAGKPHSVRVRDLLQIITPTASNNIKIRDANEDVPTILVAPTNFPSYFGDVLTSGLLDAEIQDVSIYGTVEINVDVLKAKKPEKPEKPEGGAS